LVAFALGSVAPAHNPLQIIAGRAVAGIGAAFVMPATLSLLTVAYPKEDRMKAVGMWAGTAGSGGVLGMLGSGLLLRLWDWHAIFWSLGIAGLVIFALGCTVSSSRETDAPRVDWLGAVLIGAAVAIAVFAILDAPDRGWSDPLVWGGLVAGAVIAVVSALSNSTSGIHFWTFDCSLTQISLSASRRSSFGSAQHSDSSSSACSTCSRSWATRR
jgi:MFS family permease